MMVHWNSFFTQDIQKQTDVKYISVLAGTL